MKWMKGLKDSEKRNVMITRYLDDVLFIVNSQMNDYGKVIRSYRRECYPEGLSLEGEENENNFLETTIINTTHDINCRHRNKNANMGTQEYYRGKHAWSYNEERHKMGAIIGTFTRIQRNSSRDDLAKLSVREKIQELYMLKYTTRQCEGALRYLAKKNNDIKLWEMCLSELYGVTNETYHLNP